MTIQLVMLSVYVCVLWWVCARVYVCVYDAISMHPTTRT